MSRLGNQLVTIGELSELVGFATVTLSTDAYGGQTVSNAVVTPSVRAKVRYERTDERELGSNQEKFTQEIKVWIRYDSTVTQYKALYWNSQYWDIYAIESTPGFRYSVIKARLITV